MFFSRVIEISEFLLGYELNAYKNAICNCNCYFCSLQSGKMSVNLHFSFTYGKTLFKVHPRLAKKCTLTLKTADMN